MNTLKITFRVLNQLKGDRRFLLLSILAPVIIIYFLSLLLKAFPPNVPVTAFVIPFCAFIVHFLCFILCAILLVQERTRGTLERMLISGFRRTSIIIGYALGYFGLATIQAVAVLLESLWLFKLNYQNETLFILFAVIWLLAIVSVLLGIFVSNFARHEGHVFPFIPLIILPSAFLTGLIINTDSLPTWAGFIGKCLPLHYAINIIHEINKPVYTFRNTIDDFVFLIGFVFLLWILAAVTLKETD